MIGGEADPARAAGTCVLRGSGSTMTAVDWTKSGIFVTGSMVPLPIFRMPKKRKRAASSAKTPKKKKKATSGSYLQIQEGPAVEVEVGGAVTSRLF